MPAGPDLTLAQLRCLLAVVDAGSFAEAGRRIGLSTASVSKMVGRFEAAHGVRLLHRSTHALSLTEDGRRVLGAAREASHGLEVLEATLAALAGERGTGGVRISAPVAFQRHCLVPLLPAFAREHPDIRLDLRASNDLVDLAEHSIDVAIRTGPLDAVPGHLRRSWFAFPWVLCASSAYLAGRTRPERPADLAGHDLIGFRTTHDGLIRPWRLRDPASGAAVHVAPDARFMFDDGGSGWQATLDGGGIASVPLFLAADALEDGAVVEVLRDWRAAPTPVSLVRRDARLSPPRVEAVIAFLERHPPRL